MILLGMDLGKVTSCVNILEVTKPLIGNKKTIRILKSEMVPPSLMGLTENDYKVNAPIHIKYFKELLDQYQPDQVTVESFFSRNFRTNLGGIINTLIAFMYLECLNRDISFRAFAPNTWKKALTRRVCEADRFYDKSYPAKNRTPAHAYDSMFLALYGHPRRFECVTPRQIHKLSEELASAFILRPAWLENVVVKERKKKKRGKNQKKLSDKVRVT